MGTQGPGRKRIPNREKLVAEDDALNQIAREAEARLAAKRAARAEAREIRMKELERQQKELFHSHKEDSERYSRHSRRHTSISDDEERMSVGSRGSLRPSDYSGFLGSSSRASSRASSARASPVVEDRMDRDFPDKGSRTASTLSAATLASLGGASSRRGSCDTSFSVETEASIRDIKDSLAEAEEKYRKAMVSNAQLHNEKLTLIYQVDTLREELSDMEELLWEARRQHDDRTKELERECQAHGVLQFQFKEMRETLRQTEELLTEVSDLRVKSSSYCQEVSDLQEALQWKEKKIAALERQREISDIVRIERNRLRDEVVQLRDLLKKYGVVITPEISTNGDMGQGETDDEVTAESASQWAQELSHGGRESMLGQVQEQESAEGSKPLQDGRCRIYNGSQSLSVTSSEQIKLDTVKAIVKLTNDRTEQWMGTRKPPRNEEGESDPTKKFQTRQSRRLLFRKEGNKTELLRKEPGTTAQIHEPKCGVPEELQDLRIYELKSARDTVQIQEKIQGNSTECKDQIKKKPKSSTMLSFVPTEMLKDWTGLEKTIQSILRGFVEYQDIVTKISKMVPEIPYPLNWWISELEDKLKNIAGNELTQCNRVDQQSRGLKKTTAGCELPLKEFPEEAITTQALPERSKYPPTCGFFVNSSDSRSKVYDDIQDLRESSKYEATGNAEEPEAKHSDGDPKLTSCPEDFVSVRFYFPEPSTTTAVASGLDQGLVDISTNPPKKLGVMGIVEDQAAGVVTTTNQPGVCRKLQSSIVPVEETQLKRNQSLSIKPQVVQSSNLKRVLEVTAGETEVMAIPEISLMTLQERKMCEERPIEESSGGNTKSPEEQSVKDVNSCEEADKYATAQQPATQQEHRSGMEVTDEDVKVFPVARSVKHLKRFGFDNRKDKYKSHCKSS